MNSAAWNFISTDGIILERSKNNFVVLLVFPSCPSQLCLCSRVFKISPLTHEEVSSSCTIPYSSLTCLLPFSFGNCWSSNSCAVYQRLFCAQWSVLQVKMVLLLGAVQLLMLFAGTMTMQQKSFSQSYFIMLRSQL
jgi:hypothetical protein